LALGGVLACTYLVHAYDYEKRHFSPASRPPFFGIWNVEEFLLGGKVLPPLETDGTRWQRVVFQFPTEIGIQSMNGSWMGYWLRADMAGKTLAMGKPNDSNGEFEFVFADPDSRSLTLEGTDGRNEIRVKLRRLDEKQFALQIVFRPIGEVSPESRLDEKQFALLARGFHWIDEDAALVQDE